MTGKRPAKPITPAEAVSLFALNAQTDVEAGRAVNCPAAPGMVCTMAACLRDGCKEGRAA